MKRILIISLSYFPKFVGGAEVAVKEITDRIDPEKYEFHMITNQFDSTLPKEEQIGNVMVHRIGIARPHPTIADLQKYPLKLNKPLFQLLAAWKAFRLHRRYKFSAIWGMMAHSAGIPSGIFSRIRPRVKYLLTLQEGDPPERIEHMMRPVWPLFQQAFTRAHKVQTISHFLAAWAVRMGHRHQPVVVPNAVNVAHYAREIPAETIASVAEQLGKKEGDIFLVTTSRLVHKNGIDTVIRALSFLPSHIRFAIVGTGPDEAMFRKLVAELSLTDRVVFVGHVDHQHIPAYLKACDIFIRPSRSEGMGNSFVEAMAAGLPVIGTQEGGIADFLFDAVRNPHEETTGFAVDVDDPKGIADRTLFIVQHPEVVSGVIETAKQMVTQKYDWDIIGGTMNQLFDDLIG